MRVLVPNNTPVYTIFQVTNVNCLVSLIPEQHALLAYRTNSIFLRLLKVARYLTSCIPYSLCFTWFVVLLLRKPSQVEMRFSTLALQSLTFGN